ncbi:MAG: homoserine kinase [Pelagibacterales bacterium]|nr:homoserine kinase [Pelagibacterales bacterium]
MAVYTNISLIELNEFLDLYSIGKADDLVGIKSGIENTNYLVKINNQKYILTIFEKRTHQDDLPFFFNLMNHLNDSGIKCPQAIKTKDDEYYKLLKGKPASLTSFVDGKILNRIEPNHCSELGKSMALLHNASSILNMSRNNQMGFENFGVLIKKLEENMAESDDVPIELIKNEYHFLNQNISFNLPSGIIHADLFPDNVFFVNNSLSGIIDFYFSCNDYYAYEIAICINAWCFEEKSNEFNISKAKKLLSSYNDVREITINEIDSLPLLCRAAALRFLLTRLIDFYQETSSSLLVKKDPIEYLKKLKFHQSISHAREYGL